MYYFPYYDSQWGSSTLVKHILQNIFVFSNKEIHRFGTAWVNNNIIVISMNLLSTVLWTLYINCIVIHNKYSPVLLVWSRAPQRPPAARKLSRLEVISSSVFTSCFLRESLNSARFCSSGFHYAFLLLPVVFTDLSAGISGRTGTSTPIFCCRWRSGGWSQSCIRL